MDNLFRRFKAALIDMDGVLYDSMPGHTLAWKRMMEELGVECSREEFYLYEGMTGTATINLLFNRAFGHGCDDIRAKELYEIKSRYFREMGSPKPMPGASRMLGALRSGSLKCVLVTGSGQKSLLENLDCDYPGIFGSDMRVTAHDVLKGKPDPEPYLKGLEKAGVKASEAIVIENAPLGVRAGKAAGCFTIAVTTGPIPRSEFEREGADMIFASMNEFASFLLKELEAADDVDLKLKDEIRRLEADKVFLLTDSNVRDKVILDWDIADHVYVLEAGEVSKDVGVACRLWEWLGLHGATRHSVLVNVGGGVVSDIGGFVASTFKRGIRYINVPTSLLAMADAAIGGKTGIDFMGLKNQVGTFALPEAVIVDPQLLKTLPPEEFLAGFAEVVKMAMIDNRSLYERLLEGDALTEAGLMKEAVSHAAKCKEEIVSLDPREQGLRKVLNFGHTAGHAFESYSYKIGKPISHGEAVAHGLLVALMVSSRLCGLNSNVCERYRERILCRYYKALELGSECVEDLIALMQHDKKNENGAINMVLLNDIGNPIVRRIDDLNMLREVMSGMLS